MIIFKVITEAGSMKLLTKNEVSRDGTLIVLPGFYWADKYETRPQGPYDSTTDAMNAYVRSLELRQARPRKQNNGFTPALGHLTLVEEEKDNVIKADFVNKKRVK